MLTTTSDVLPRNEERRSAGHVMLITTSDLFERNREQWSEGHMPPALHHVMPITRLSLRSLWFWTHCARHVKPLLQSCSPLVLLIRFCFQVTNWPRQLITMCVHKKRGFCEH